MYTPYRVNIWGLRKPVANREETVTQLGIYGEFRILVQTRQIMSLYSETSKVQNIP